MRTILLAAAAVPAFGIGAASAGDGGWGPFPCSAPFLLQQRATVLDMGNMACQATSLLPQLPTSRFAAGPLLTTQASVALRQTANFLPRGG